MTLARIEDLVEEGKEKCRLICNVECGFSDENAVWFTVDKKYKDWLCADVYDAFLMAMLCPAMPNFFANALCRRVVSRPARVVT